MPSPTHPMTTGALLTVILFIVVLCSVLLCYGMFALFVTVALCGVWHGVMVDSDFCGFAHYFLPGSVGL